MGSVFKEQVGGRPERDREIHRDEEEAKRKETEMRILHPEPRSADSCQKLER